jgi:hypothetical protein
MEMIVLCTWHYRSTHCLLVGGTDFYNSHRISDGKDRFCRQLSPHTLSLCYQSANVYTIRHEPGTIPHTQRYSTEQNHSRVLCPGWKLIPHIAVSPLSKVKLLHHAESLACGTGATVSRSHHQYSHEKDIR